jgi:hypothetical protein
MVASYLMNRLYNLMNISAASSRFEVKPNLSATKSACSFVSPKEKQENVKVCKIINQV